MKTWILLLFCIFEANALLKLKPDVKEVTKTLNSSVLLACILEEGEEDEENDDDAGGGGSQEEEGGLLSWLDFHGNEIKESSGRLFTEEQEGSIKKLYIQSINQHDTGSYTCQHNKHPRLHPPVSIKLSLYQELSFVAPPIQYLNQSEDALIKCVVKGTPLPTVIWTFNNKKIILGSKYKLSDEGLLVRAVSVRDRGMYQCRAEVMADGRFDKKKIMVYVRYKPECSNCSQSQTILTKVGVLNITCSSKAEPAPTFDWFVYSNASTNRSQASWSRVQSDSRDIKVFKKSKFASVLQISQQEPHATYICQASNFLDSINQTYHVVLSQSIAVAALSSTQTSVLLSWQPAIQSNAFSYSLSHRKVKRGGDNSTWVPLSDWSVLNLTPPPFVVQRGMKEEVAVDDEEKDENERMKEEEDEAEEIEKISEKEKEEKDEKEEMKEDENEEDEEKIIMHTVTSTLKPPSSSPSSSLSSSSPSSSSSSSSPPSSSSSSPPPATIPFIHNLTHLLPLCHYQVVFTATDAFDRQHTTSPLIVTTKAGSRRLMYLPASVLNSLGGQQRAFAIIISTIVIFFVVVFIFLFYCFLRTYVCKRKKEADGREDEECLKVKLEGKKKKESCKGSKKEEDCLKVVRNGDGCVKEVSEGVASNAAVVCKKLAGEEEEDNDDGGSTLAGSKTASCETGSGDETRGKVTGVEEAPLLRPSYQPSFSTPPPPYSNALSSNNICNNNNNISNNNSISNNISISNNGNSNTPEAQRPFIEEGDESPHSPHQAGLLSSSCYVPREENSQQAASKNRRSIMALGDERWKMVVDELHEQLGVARRSDELIPDESEEGEEKEEEEEPGTYHDPPSPKWKHT